MSNLKTKNMSKFNHIIDLIKKGRNTEAIKLMDENGIYFYPIDKLENTFFHKASFYGNIEILKCLLEKDKEEEPLEINRTINDTNELSKTALDYAKTDDVKKLLLKYGAITGEEVEKRFEKMENQYYDAMEDISKIQLAGLVGNKMFKAISDNNLEEFIKLYNLNSEEGGLILYRITSVNNENKSFLEKAKELERKEIIDFLKSKKHS